MILANAAYPILLEPVLLTIDVPLIGLLAFSAEFYVYWRMFSCGPKDDRIPWYNWVCVAVIANVVSSFFGLIVLPAFLNFPLTLWIIAFAMTCIIEATVFVVAFERGVRTVLAANIASYSICIVAVAIVTFRSS